MKRCLLILITAIGLSSNPAHPGYEPFLGEIMLVGSSYCPDQWAEANGAVLNISDYDALFSLYGCSFGGNCVTTFALPDLRGRVAVGLGSGPGLTPRDRGEVGGDESVSLNLLQMPAHTHSLSNVTLTGTVNVSSSAGTTNAPSGQALSDSNRTSLYSDGSLDASLVEGSVSVSGQSGDEVASAGGGRAHNNMPPYVVLRYCVALKGVYPERPE